MNMEARKLTDEEKAIVTALIRAGDRKWSHLTKSLSSVKVMKMEDGEMGSLSFSNGKNKDRKLGYVVSQAEFTDGDDIAVSVALNLDEEGQLFELDFWKVNFEELINIPLPSQLKFVPFE
jgi:hypothetical protein